MEPFGTLPDGRPAHLVTLSNTRGTVARISDFGATLVSLDVADRDGRSERVTLGFDSVDGYLGPHNAYYGCTAGRFANRIAAGRFELDGDEHQLAINNGPNHLHGGPAGFSHRLWSIIEHGPDAVTFELVSADGDEQYPGRLTARVTYRLSEDNELVWEASATSEAPTIVNFVHHSYWNLSGRAAAAVTDHELTLHAERFLPTNPVLIPTGELRTVAGTPMDFTAPQAIGSRIDDAYPPLAQVGTYDHCWVVQDGFSDQLVPVARLRDPASGRTMEISSNQPGVQLYVLRAVPERAENRNDPHGSGACLETENFPDAPNQPGFPSAVLRPGETYRHVMVHRFTAE